MILVCPTAFKGTLSASEVTRAIVEGVREARVEEEIRQQPLSDGGNGLLNALEAVGGGRGRAARVPGPLGTSVTARYLVQEERVVVETAEACGLHLVPDPLLDPMRASTRGVGELLLAASAAVPDRQTLVIGLGGSATVDAGAGMVTALGWRLIGDDGEPVPPGGDGLLRLSRIEAPAEPPSLPDLVVLADVTNPLLGSMGAAPAYGPQKGASPEQVKALAKGLERWARIVERDLGRDVGDLPFTGAAGGLGAAFTAFLDAEPHAGSDWVLDDVAFDDALAEATVVITGEGAWTETSSMGKVTGEVIRRARRRKVPVILVTARAESGTPDGVTVLKLAGERVRARGVATQVAESLPGLLPKRSRP